MPKKTSQEQFLHVLSSMAAKTSDARVSKVALEEKLGWKKPGLFNKVRQQLLDEGAIKSFVGGPGGTMALAKAPPPPARPLKAFLSYSHRDKDLALELIKHLHPLVRLELVEPWHDGQIDVGDDWEKKIQSNLKNADLIILLVTADFINSKYCYENEFKTAVKRHEVKKTRLVPVIGRHCLWEDLPFGKIQAARGGQPLKAAQHLDEALTEVAKEIKKVAQAIREEQAVAA